MADPVSWYLIEQGWEVVGEIVEGRVALTIDGEAFERLDHYDEPPTTEEIES